MDERRAREVTLLEAFETAQPASASWSDDDRRWADRVALEAATPGSAPAAFVATRAGHALQRLAPREPALARAQAQPSWRVLAWNLAVYVLLVAMPIVRVARRYPVRRGPIVRAAEILLRLRQRL